MGGQGRGGEPGQSLIYNITSVSLASLSL